MAEYERTMTARQLAQATLRQCFYVIDEQVYINYGKILGIYQTIHQVLLEPPPYRQLTQADTNYIYAAYKAIATGEYHTVVLATGDVVAVPNNKLIPQSVFAVVADLIDLTRRE